MKKSLSTYLQIAGFFIKLVFRKTEPLSLMERTQGMIESHLDGFVIKNKPKKVNYLIEFIYPKFFKVTRKNDHVFVLLYQKQKGWIKTFYHISLEQFYFIVNRTINELLNASGFMIHGSAVAIDGKVSLFIGGSGAGKSTIIKLLKNVALAVADDMVIIKKEKDGKFYLYETPFIEKEGWFSKINERFVINNIYFLKKASFIKTKKITDNTLLFQKLSRQFWAEKPNKKQFRLLLEFTSKSNNFNFLFFPKNQESVENFFKKTKSAPYVQAFTL